MPDEQIEFEIVRDNDALSALRDDWQRLWELSADSYYVLSFPVLWRAWTQVIAPLGNSLHIVVGRSGGRVVLIWPAMIRAEKLHGFWRVAGWFGRDPIDYGEVLVEPTAQRDTWMEAALAQLVSAPGVDFLALESVRGDSNVYGVLEGACRWQVAEDPAPFIDLRGVANGDELEAKLPKRFRQSMRRRARRLEEIGPLKFEFEREPGRLEETIRWIVDRKREWIDERGIAEGHGLTDEHATSMIDIIRDGAKAGHALVSRLSVNDELIAADVSLLAGNRLYSDYGSFDLGWGKYSPGSLLLRETIKWAVDNGVEIFDLARGPDDYKIKWSSGKIELTRYLIPCTLRGRIYVVLRTSPVHKWFRWAKAKLKSRGSASQQGEAQPADATAGQ
ncbi:MAG: GNAT family N-acetyltransferase [Alphaproteobacteria bacterium]|nr:GNAT family N-acetyltransferase [Alphaproteobacteria bacterium]